MAIFTLKYVFYAVEILIGYNLVLPFFLLLVYALKRKTTFWPASAHPTQYDYAIIVTAYEQTDSLPPVVESLLNINYNKFIIYIVADKCDVSKLKFADQRVVVLRPETTLASNTRSHFYAINRFQRNHDVLIIIDSDNLADRECLNELNKCFDAGYDAVQGLREAKNLDTTFACLDASRDIYYHFYDGQLLFNLGSSATLCGSGMAFKVSLYRECLEHLDITGAGFDKVLQREIVNRGHRIAFNEHAIVFDEKTSKSDQLVKQRARWINTWFKYFKFGFTMVGKGLAGFNFNQLLFGIILLRPPLFIFLLLSVAFMGISFLLSPLAGLIWVGAFLLFILGFLAAILRAKPDKRIIKSLVGIPKFMFLQVLSLLRARNANKLSVATTHYNAKSINEINKT
jgi:cellulose synthase/poly-beta-1,6-N-acetylglucosamine synthase-like glycosyltransferase